MSANGGSRHFYVDILDITLLLTYVHSLRIGLTSAIITSTNFVADAKKIVIGL